MPEKENFSKSIYLSQKIRTIYHQIKKENKEMRGRKILVMLLGMVLILTVVACGNKETEKKKPMPVRITLATM